LFAEGVAAGVAAYWEPIEELGEDADEGGDGDDGPEDEDWE
jgi:hypothetical protein